MLAGLFGRGAIVKISASDQKAALALDGAAMFDPMRAMAKPAAKSPTPKMAQPRTVAKQRGTRKG
jgi:hypothetical protein